MPCGTRCSTVFRFFFQAEDGIRDIGVTGVQTCALPIYVYRMGTLVQHIDTSVNHAAGRKVPVAHKVQIDPESKLASVVNSPQSPLVISVNSSHHQAAEAIGDGLRVVAKCPEDGVIEALEGTSPDHFVLAVQWHPERSTDDDPSRSIFRSLVEAARTRHEELSGEFESV